eukprot:scaffold6960_cov104-Isochrysis_galbana.AAC.3
MRAWIAESSRRTGVSKSHSTEPTASNMRRTSRDLLGGRAGFVLGFIVALTRPLEGPPPPAHAAFRF